MTELEAFRRARGLLSGDDLRAWLEVAGLDEEDWAARVLAGETSDLPGALPVAGRARPSVPAPVIDPPPPQVWIDAPGRCGDAAMLVVCRALGMRTRVRVGEDATLAEIVDAAREAGLPATALKASRRRLDELPAPWIAHVDGHHWVVVHRADAHEVVVSDPARGAGSLDRAAFEARWTGWCAVFAPVVQSD